MNRITHRCLSSFTSLIYGIKLQLLSSSFRQRTLLKFVVAYTHHFITFHNSIYIKKKIKNCWEPTNTLILYLLLVLPQNSPSILSSFFYSSPVPTHKLIPWSLSPSVYLYKPTMTISKYPTVIPNLLFSDLSNSYTKISMFFFCYSCLFILLLLHFK